VKRIQTHRRLTAAYGIVGLALICLPHFLGSYLLHVLIIAGIWVILASSLNLIYGYMGHHSFGHAAFYAIGAYTTTLLTMNWKISFWAALPAGAIMAGFFGVLIGWPSVRLKGASFAIVTLGFGEIVKIILVNQQKLFGGASGITGIPSPDPIRIPFLSDLSFGSKTVYYYLVLLFVFVTIVIMKRVMASPFGLAVLAIRENDSFAQSLGINVMKYKVAAFAVATIFAGVAGSLFAHYTHFISPYSFTVNESFEMAIMVVFGGSGTIIGPVIGAVLLTFLPDLLQTMKDLRLVVYGAILMLTMIFLPKGLAGLLSMICENVKPRLGRKSASLNPAVSDKNGRTSERH
jgi:branched-chain amino acid transport system permease protein